MFLNLGRKALSDTVPYLHLPPYSTRKPSFDSPLQRKPATSRCQATKSCLPKGATALALAGVQVVFGFQEGTVSSWIPSGALGRFRRSSSEPGATSLWCWPMTFRCSHVFHLTSPEDADWLRIWGSPLTEVSQISLHVEKEP